MSFKRLFLLFAFLFIFMLPACKREAGDMNAGIRIIYLHHSTGRIVWEGKKNLLEKFFPAYDKPAIVKYLEKYDGKHGTHHRITSREYPANAPYGWQNYPYDYYNIWVKHGKQDYYLEEPTLNFLTAQYDVVVFKHCFPVSHISTGTSQGDPDSPEKSLANYKIQYQLLKEKMRSYPDT